MSTIPVVDDDAIADRIDAIDRELAQNTGADRDALEEERQSLEDQVIARSEYDRNEEAGMSSTDATIDTGRPNSHPLNKLKDKISGKKPEKQQDEQQQEHEPTHDHEKSQSRPEPHEQQQQDHEQQQSKPEPDTGPPQDAEPATGIRTIPVVEVNIVPGPHSTPSQPSTNQQQPEAMRALGRQQYQQTYMNTANVWQYPNSRHNTDQVGLVQQSYKSYFGLN